MNRIEFEIVELSDGEKERYKQYSGSVKLTKEILPFFIKTREKHASWWTKNLSNYNSYLTEYQNMTWLFNQKELDYLTELVNKYNHDIEFNNKFQETIK